MRSRILVLIVIGLFCGVCEAQTYNHYKLFKRIMGFPLESQNIELTTEQEKVVLDAVGKFVDETKGELLSNVPADIAVSSKGVSVSAGFSLVSTGIRVSSDGKAYLSVNCNVGGFSVIIETEFGSMGDLVNSVGKSLKNTAMLVPYTYRRIQGENLKFSEYFEVYSGQRPTTIKMRNPFTGKDEILYSSTLSGIDFSSPSETSSPQIPKKEGSSNEDGRLGSGGAKSLVPEPEPAVKIGGYAYAPGLIKSQGKEYYFSWTADTFQFIAPDDGEFWESGSGEVKMGADVPKDISNPSGGTTNQEVYLSFDEDKVNSDPFQNGSEWSNWGYWADPMVSFPGGTPVPGDDLRIVYGYLTPQGRIPKIGQGIYRGKTLGEQCINGVTSPVTGDVTLNVKFSDGSIKGLVDNYFVWWSQEPSWDLDLKIDSKSQEIQGTMRQKITGINADVNANFFGPQGEDINGQWIWQENGDYRVGNILTSR